MLTRYGAFDWNCLEPRRRLVRPYTALLDETLRDGIQNPSVRDPSTAEKLEILHVMDELGIHVVNAGMPAASRRSRDDTEAICREIETGRLAIRPAAAGRTLVADIVPIVEISERVGIEIEVYTFIGSSPVRQLVEAWDVSDLVDHASSAIDFAVGEGLPVCLVVEDTTRSRPEALRTLWRAAIEHGVSRLCIADTVGHATRDGMESLVRFCRHVLLEAGANEVGIDWHGHDDRGLALDNALRALEYGVDRVHATALGIGERCGNTPMELLLSNLALLGELDGFDFELVRRYCELVGSATGWVIPSEHPLLAPERSEGTRPNRSDSPSALGASVSALGRRIG